MFCFDTSALLECWSRYYPIDVFPGIWERFAYLVEGGDVIAPDEVHEEIKKKDDGLAEWLKTRPGMFVPARWTSSNCSDRGAGGVPGTR